MCGAANMQISVSLQFVTFVASVCLARKLLKFVFLSDQFEVFFVVTVNGDQAVVGCDQKLLPVRTLVSSIVFAYGR